MACEGGGLGPLRPLDLADVKDWVPRRERGLWRGYRMPGRKFSAFFFFWLGLGILETEFSGIIKSYDQCPGIQEEIENM